jgi:hypothetical protein
MKHSMNVLKFYTTRVSLKDSWAVRHWGVAGARRFWWGWGAFLYGFLALIGGNLFTAIARQAEPGDQHIFYLAAALIVIVASVLTRMLMGILAELRALESSDTRKADIE